MPRSKAYINPAPAGDVPANAPQDAVKREFAKRVQSAMVEKGWNQSELGRQATKHMPIDPRTRKSKEFGRDNISGYIRAMVLPGPVHLTALARALDKAPGDLLPTRGIPSSETKVPAIEARDAGGGKAWLRVNQAVDWDVALQVLKILKAES
jgi:transcriptional regulator with XRE-family HTH domain